MSYDAKRAVEQYEETLRREGVADYVIDGVLRDARVLHRLAERECSDPSYGPADEAHVDQLQARISANLLPFGVTAHFQADPRGAVVKLRLPSGAANDFGGEGYWCVP